MNTYPNSHEQISTKALEMTDLGKAKSKKRHNTGGVILRITILVVIILASYIPLYIIYSDLIDLTKSLDKIKSYTAFPAVVSSKPEIALNNDNTQITN